MSDQPDSKNEVGVAGLVDNLDALRLGITAAQIFTGAKIWLEGMPAPLPNAEFIATQLTAPATEAAMRLLLGSHQPISDVVIDILRQSKPPTD